MVVCRRERGKRPRLRRSEYLLQDQVDREDRPGGHRRGVSSEPNVARDPGGSAVLLAGAQLGNKWQLQRWVVQHLALTPGEHLILSLARSHLMVMDRQTDTPDDKAG